MRSTSESVTGLKQMYTSAKTVFQTNNIATVCNLRVYSPYTMSEKSERIAVFMFILIEWITDQGQNIEEALMNQQFSYDELPHLTTARYRDILAQLNVFDTDGLATIVTNMARMGFAERINDQTFAFRSPVYRFLDICQDIARTQKQEEPAIEEPEQ